MALPLNNSAEGQTSGTAVSAGGANTGGASGDAFDEGVTGTNMALAFDNGFPAHGVNGYKITQNSTTPAITYLGWSATVFGTAVTTLYGRLYYRIATLPVNSSIRLVEFFFGATVVGWIGMASGANTFHFRTAADAALTPQSGAISAATMYRIEFQVGVTGATCTGTGKVYAGDSLTTAVTDFGFASQSWGTASGINHVRFGVTTANYEILSGKTFTIDDINLNSTGLPGPAIPSAYVRNRPTVVNQAVMRGVTRMQKLTQRKSGLFVPAEWSEKIMVPA